MSASLRSGRSPAYGKLVVCCSSGQREGRLKETGEDRGALGERPRVRYHTLRLTLICPSCSTRNTDDSSFCKTCATPLDTPARSMTGERRIVTSLFCDLVGFTATSEMAGPEDVDTMLAAYFAMARKEIEAFGGIVEKFIGDAVGVFGVSAAHEDDPERAIRAGLRICEAAEELTSIEGAPLKLRVGINTGEALVRLARSGAAVGPQPSR